MKSRSRRVSYVLLALGTIAIGLGVHWYGGALGPALRDVAGDAIWAVMITWWVAAIAPTASLRDRAFESLAICFAVEFSQLVHTPALDAMRRTTLGQLTLGSGFDTRDLGAYGLGVFAAMLGEWGVRRRLQST
jgi:hypothetical protein